MVYTFLNKTVSLLKKIFFTLFSAHDERQTLLHHTNLDTWKELGHLRTTSTGTIYIFEYQKQIIKDALYYIKNKMDATLAEKLCTISTDIILEYLAEENEFKNYKDLCIISIPPHKDQLHKRGFNPSELIAKIIAKELNIEYIPSALELTKQTKSQKTLSKQARKDNIKNSMGVSSRKLNSLQDKSVIIMDDITTTGATLTEAKRALTQAKPRHIICIAMAH